MPENNIKSAIEAMLFASDRPLIIEQIKRALDNLPADEVRKNILELKAEYDNSNRGMRVVEVAGGFQMITALDFAPFLKKLYKNRAADRLSKQGLETLAIIAYKQPLTKLEIELLRNVNVDGVMGSLLARDLIKVVGRKKAPGTPKVYGTTKQFLEHFGLRSLEDLPPIENFTVSEAVKDVVLKQDSQDNKENVEDGSREPTPSN